METFDDLLGQVDKKNLPQKRGPVFQLQLPKGYEPGFTDDQRQALIQYFERQRGDALDAVAMTCKGSECPIKSDCVIWKEMPDLLPVGERCPIEATLAEGWYQDLKRELEIGDDDVVDIAQLKELVMYRIYKRRAMLELGQDTSMIRRSFTGRVDEEGEPLFEEQLNPIHTFLEKQTKASKRLWDSLLATREAKSKDGSRQAQGMAEVLQALRERVEARRIRKAEFRIKEDELPDPPLNEEVLIEGETG